MTQQALKTMRISTQPEIAPSQLQYDWFTEGFETVDLMRARQVMTEIRSALTPD